VTTDYIRYQTDTNYNREADATDGIYGMREVAAYLGDELVA